MGTFKGVKILFEVSMWKWLKKLAIQHLEHSKGPSDSPENVTIILINNEQELQSFTFL